MQILVFLAVALIGFTINFGWDLTVRRTKARALTEVRRAARPRALPPVPDGSVDQRPISLASDELRTLVDHSRTTFAELDQLIDHFDLLLLRAKARARFGVVTVKAVEPRTAACELLDAWLETEMQIDVETRTLLTNLGFAPVVVAGVLARERERAGWEFRSDTAAVLEDTITDLDRAIIHLQGVVRALERDTDNPYR